MSKSFNNMTLDELINSSNAVKSEIDNNIKKAALLHLENEKKREKQTIINRYLYKKCSHKWEWDGEIPGPYDKMEKKCTICGLYENEYFN